MTLHFTYFLIILTDYFLRRLFAQCTNAKTEEDKDSLEEVGSSLRPLLVNFFILVGQIEEKAISHGHSTPQLAGRFAVAIRARLLLLTHFSGRSAHLLSFCVVPHVLHSIHAVVLRYKGDCRPESVEVMAGIAKQARDAMAEDVKEEKDGGEEWEKLKMTTLDVSSAPREGEKDDAPGLPAVVAARDFLRVTVRNDRSAAVDSCKVETVEEEIVREE